MNLLCKNCGRPQENHVDDGREIICNDYQAIGQADLPRIRIKDNWVATRSEWNREFTVEGDRVYTPEEMETARVQAINQANALRVEVEKSMGPTKAEKELAAQVTLLEAEVDRITQQIAEDAEADKINALMDDGEPPFGQTGGPEVSESSRPS